MTARLKLNAIWIVRIEGNANQTVNVPVIRDTLGKIASYLFLALRIAPPPKMAFARRIQLAAVLKDFKGQPANPLVKEWVHLRYPALIKQIKVPKWLAAKTIALIGEFAMKCWEFAFVKVGILAIIVKRMKKIWLATKQYLGIAAPIQQLT